MEKINYDYIFKGNTLYGKPENLTQIELNPSNFFGSVNSNININIIKLDHNNNKNKNTNEVNGKNNAWLKKDPTEVLLNDRNLNTNKPQKKTLVLDLDETLIHSSMTPFPNRTNIVLQISIGPDNYTIYSIQRPFVEEFFNEMSLYFDIILFTASLEQYSSPLLQFIDKNKVIKHVYNREYCKYFEGCFFKDLSIINKDYKDLIIIDNNPASYSFNKENGIPIKSWFDDPNDNELIKLIPFMKFLGKVFDVRPFVNLAVNKNTGQLDYKIVDSILNDNADKNNLKINNTIYTKHTLKKSISENLKKNANLINENKLKNNIITNNNSKTDIKLNKNNILNSNNDKKIINNIKNSSPKDSVKKNMDKIENFATVNTISNGNNNFNYEKMNKFNTFRKANKKKRINIIGVHKITIQNKEQEKKFFDFTQEEKKINNIPNNQEKNENNSKNIILEKNTNLNPTINHIKNVFTKKEGNKEKNIISKRNSYVSKDSMNIKNFSLVKENTNTNKAQQNKNVSKENMRKNQQSIQNKNLQTNINKKPDSTKDNKQEYFNIINDKNHVTEIGQKYLKTFRKVKNNKQRFEKIKNSKKLSLDLNSIKGNLDKNQASLIKSNLNNDLTMKNDTSILIPKNELSKVVQQNLKDNDESKTIKKFEIFTPIKVSKVTDTILKSFKLKSIKSKILFNNVRKCSNNSRNFKNAQNLSRSSKKVVVMKIIRNNSIISNSCYLNTEKRFSVTHNSTKMNMNTEDFDNDANDRFNTTSQIFLNKNYISSSHLNNPKVQKTESEAYHEKKKSLIAQKKRIDRKTDFVSQEIYPL